MTQWTPPRTAEIDRKLREDFRRLLKEYGSVPQETDPILAVLFRSFATQIAEVYGQAAHSIPQAVLDELIASIGMPPRQAHPAQTVVRFTVQEGRESLAAGTELMAEAASKEKLTFALDNELQVSTAAISLVAIYQQNTLRLHQGTDLTEDLERAQPSFEAVAADLGPSPAIFLALEVDEAVHLSRHGLFFELHPEAIELQNSLQQEVWCLLDDQGQVGPEGLLRPVMGNGGVRRLQWLTADEAKQTANTLLPEGFYGSRVFLLPDIPPEKRFLTTLPEKMEAPLKRIFQSAGVAMTELFDRPRAWVRIALPQTTTTVADDLLRVVLHCATASNVEVLNQKVIFAEMGTSIPIGNSGRRPRFLVHPLSIKGEYGTEYLPETAPTSDTAAGQYRIRQGRLEFKPAQNESGVPDQYAVVRLLLTNGNLKKDKAKTNGDSDVSAGAIKTFLNRSTPRTLEIRNLNAAEGGTDGETFTDARSRFAEALLTRDRIVTQLDLEARVKAFDHRIRQVRAESALERQSDGLHRVQRITIGLERATFTVPEKEAVLLQTELEADVQRRVLMGVEIRVKTEWI